MTPQKSTLKVNGRTGDKSAQLLRPYYNRQTKKMATRSVGSVSCEVDLQADQTKKNGFNLKAGTVLDAADLAEIQGWLDSLGASKVTLSDVSQRVDEVLALLRAGGAIKAVTASNAEPSVVVAPAAQLPGAAASNEASEDKLLRLLCAIETACDEIISLMPTEAKVFKRGHAFEKKTVLQAQRLWFKTSDAIKVMGGRDQFHRPQSWAPLRETVLGPSE